MYSQLHQMFQILNMWLEKSHNQKKHCLRIQEDTLWTKNVEYFERNMKANGAFNCKNTEGSRKLKAFLQIQLWGQWGELRRLLLTHSSDHLKTMQCVSYSRGYHRAYKHRPKYHVPNRELLVKFFELQQQFSQLNKLVHLEQVQSQVQRNIIKGLQRQLKSTTRRTETQRVLKEKSILREEEIKRELVRLIKVHCRESPRPESNNRQKRRKKKSPHAEQETVVSEMGQGTLQDRCRRDITGQQKARKVPQVQVNQKRDFVRQQADATLDAPTNELSFKEKEQCSQQKIEELLMRFKQNCSLKVRISIKPKDEGQDRPQQEH